jgi:dihydrofolate synthase/folylpolyglutamate synthase
MPLHPAYQSALDYIFSFVDYSKTHAANLDPKNFDLARVHDLLHRLGGPQRAYPAIHIAGTKGKGSTAALCASALTAAGYRTGLYTSPHLQDFTERIQVDGAPIPPAAVAGLIEEIKPHAAAVPLISTFEIITALGFLHFQRAAVDAAVIEVGLGGRLDATNVLTPLVSVITSLSLDHVPILGATLAEIAAEKAGIIKPGVPVVSAPQAVEAAAVLARAAAAQAAPLTIVGEHVQYEGLERGLDGQAFRVGFNGGDMIELRIPLLGSHQVDNAATAWAALQLAGGRGLPSPGDAIQKGFARTRWAGRFEILRREPFVILDAAHNPDSAEKLRRTLQDYLPGRPLVLVFGASGDKAVPEFLHTFAPITSLVIAARSTHPRALHPDAIAAIANGLGIPCEVCDPIETALARALQAVPPQGVALVTGSVFVAGAARQVWFARYSSQL